MLQCCISGPRLFCCHIGHHLSTWSTPVTSFEAIVANTDMTLGENTNMGAHPQALHKKESCWCLSTVCMWIIVWADTINILLPKQVRRSLIWEPTTWATTVAWELGFLSTACHCNVNSSHGPFNCCVYILTHWPKSYPISPYSLQPHFDTQKNNFHIFTPFGDYILPILNCIWMKASWRRGVRIELC